MNPQKSLAITVSLSIILIGCQKSVSLEEAIFATNSPGPETYNQKILVDASKDGGVWWFPQSDLTGFSAAQYHQGKALADYLRSQGFIVDELPRGAVVTTTILQSYNKIIRANGFSSYAAEEINAYDQFLKKSSALLLIQDHMQYTTNDKLSQHLGLQFAGVAHGTITRFNPHEITNGTTSIPYIAGSAVVNQDKSNIVVLGSLGATEYVDVNRSGGYDSGDILSPPVLGILKHPSCKIIFLGDINGLEVVPQPFTRNLLNWLFK